MNIYSEQFCHPFQVLLTALILKLLKFSGLQKVRCAKFKKKTTLTVLLQVHFNCNLVEYLGIKRILSLFLSFRSYFNEI